MLNNTTAKRMRKASLILLTGKTNAFRSSFCMTDIVHSFP